jgi:hypothetical protein
MKRAIEITTLRTTSGSCPDNRTCPSIHSFTDRPDRRYVVTKRVTDPDEIAAFAPLVADDEQVGWVPATLIPEVT